MSDDKKMKEQLKEIGKEALGLVKDIADGVCGKGTEMAESIGDAANKTKESLVVKLEDAKQKTCEMKDKTISAAKETTAKAEAAIKEHPIKSVAIATSAGLALGLLAGLLTRKRK